MSAGAGPQRVPGLTNCVCFVRRWCVVAPLLYTPESPARHAAMLISLNILTTHFALTIHHHPTGASAQTEGPIAVVSRQVRKSLAKNDRLIANVN